MKLLLKNLIYPLINSSPDFLIIGVQRAGTTSLYRYLINHPQILISHQLRETYYFDVDENYQKGWGWYLGHFPSHLAKGKKLTFEASPSYLFQEKVPQRIKQKLGNIKMIILLRNPVERAYSAWQMFHSYAHLNNEKLKKRADLRSFSQAIYQELNEPNQITKYPYDYLKRGIYWEQINNYLQYFSRDEILILDFCEFSKDISLTLNKVCQFLNIEQFSEQMLEKYKNQKYASANYLIQDEDEKVLNLLKEYFQPLNQKLYDFLDINYNW